MTAIPRIADLEAAPGAVRLLSVKPVLEDVVGKLPVEGLSWVIGGGESGPGARPMQEDWVLSIRKPCKAAGLAYFFKQYGGVRKKVAGRAGLRTHKREVEKAARTDPDSQRPCGMKRICALLFRSRRPRRLIFLHASGLISNGSTRFCAMLTNAPW